MNSTRLSFFIIVIGLCIAPAFGNTIYYDDTVDTTYSFSSSSSYQHKHLFKGFYTPDISALPTVSRIYLRMYDMGTFQSAYDSEDYFLTDNFNFIGKIGTTAIASGEVTIINHPVASSLSECNEIEYIFQFDEYDVTGYSGAQFMDIDIPSYESLFDGNIMPILVGTSSGLTDGSNTAGCSGSTGWVCAEGTLTFIDAPKILTQTDVVGEIHQMAEYTVVDKILNIDFYRNGTANNVLVKSTDGETYYNTQESVDVQNIIVYNKTATWLNVTNPLDSSVWSNLLPETSTPEEPETDPAEFTSYIFDAQSGQLISGASVNKYYSDDSHTSTAGASGKVHDVVYWDETDWAYFNVSASGYSYTSAGYNWTADSAPPGFHQQMIFQMMPDAAPSNSTYVLAFNIRQEISPGADVYSRSVDATVICDDVQHLSGPSGTTWFNVSAGSHSYTVSKNGFETVQGTVTVSALNTLETVYLPLSIVEPTLAGNETSGEVGDEDMHEAIAKAYAEFGAFIPEAVMIGCVLFLLSMFKKF